MRHSCRFGSFRRVFCTACHKNATRTKLLKLVLRDAKTPGRGERRHCQVHTCATAIDGGAFVPMGIELVGRFKDLRASIDVRVLNGEAVNDSSSQTRAHGRPASIADRA